MKKTLIPIMFGVVSTLLFSFFQVKTFLPFERLELLLYDVKYEIRGKQVPPKEVVIVGISDSDIEKFGRWPWDRRRIASLIEGIGDMGAKVILTDIVLSEPAVDDDALGAVIEKAGNVILPVVFDFEGGKRKIEADALYDSAFRSVKNAADLKEIPPKSANSVLLPVKGLSSKARTLGHINIIPDSDGKLRWEVMAVEYDGDIYPSIDLQAARLFLDLPENAMALVATKGVRLGERHIPTDPRGKTLIRYYGPEKTFPYITAADILERKIKPSAIRGKVVVLGVTAVAVYDLRVTPTSSAMAGVEKHANVIASILKNAMIVKTNNDINVLVIVVSGILFSFLIVRVKAVFGAFLTLFFVSALFLITYYLFFLKGLWMPLSYPGNNVLVVYLAVTAYRYATEERYAKRIRGMFSSYVTEKIVNELIKNPNLARVGGERREITVLFSDIRDFTVFSEKYQPEEVVAMLNEYLGEMTHVILSWEGTVNKFVGDMIVAFWGAPLPQENHAELAVQCAAAMAKRLRELQEIWKKEGKPVLYAGIGINTGDVIVGNIGAEGKKMEYTVIGDNVNLGSRVEGLTRVYNTDIIITEFTLDKIRQSVQEGRVSGLKMNGLEKVVVKGRTQPVCLYELLARKEGDKSVIVECEEGDIVHHTEK
jgi:adenylate cyclase